jgi:hypothetical protein
MKFFGYNEILTAILSFLGGLFSFAAGLRIQSSFDIGFIKLIQIKYQLGRAYKEEDSKRIEILTLLLSEKKLYSNSEVKQATAIATLLNTRIDNERLFNIFIERLASDPKISTRIRETLIYNIKRIILVTER